MHPVLFEWEVFGVHRMLGTFGLFFALGMLVSATVAVRIGARIGLDTGLLSAALGLTAGGGMIGAYLFFAIVELLRTGHFDPMTQGGLVFYGGLVGGWASLWAACRFFELPFLRFVDAAVVAIPLGHAVGRMACLMGGCCYGAATELPWGIVYTHPMAPASIENVSRHPTPIYESLLLLLAALVMQFWAARDIGRGRRLARYAILYAVLRSVVESFRGDGIRGVWWLGLSTSQWISVGIAAVALLWLGSTRRWVAA